MLFIGMFIGGLVVTVINLGFELHYKFVTMNKRIEYLENTHGQNS